MQGRGLEPGRVTGDEEQRACVAPDARDSALVRSERRRGREDEELIELVAGDHLAHREAGAVGARAQRELDRISGSVPVGRRGRRGEHWHAAVVLDRVSASVPPVHTSVPRE
jgi:hypothetical protein